MQYIQGHNLCDLITEKPAHQYGALLGEWFAKYHQAFQRGEESKRVLLKGDARIRNFIYHDGQIFGVDFEECVTGHYLTDLAVTCASVLDTNPLFTPGKFALCRSLLEEYSGLREIDSSTTLIQAITPHLLRALKATAIRRGNPTELVKCIHQFEAGKLHLESSQ
jgi:aminoglycoside phosphotransferase (APT) family kinase protein